MKSGRIPAIVVPAVLFLISAAPAAPKVAGYRPQATDVSRPRVLRDIQDSYDQKERELETEYAKLVQEARNEIHLLEDKISGINRQVENLKKQLQKIALVISQLESLQPHLFEFVGSKPAGLSARMTRNQQNPLAAIVRGELARIGIVLSDEKLQDLVTAMGQGGQAGIAVALSVAVTIAETSAEISLQQRGRSSLSLDSLAAAAAPLRSNPNADIAAQVIAQLQALLSRIRFPEVPPSAISAAAGMPGGTASAYFSSLFHAQRAKHSAAVSKKINGKVHEKKALQAQITELNKVIEKLYKTRDKMIAALRAAAKAAQEAQQKTK